MSSEVMRIYNSSRQMIQLQARPPKTDFFTNEVQIRLNPGQSVDVVRNHMNMDQIENLCKKGLLKVVYDSQAQS